MYIPWAITPGRPTLRATSSSWWIGLSSPLAAAYRTRSARVIVKTFGLQASCVGAPVDEGGAGRADERAGDVGDLAGRADDVVAARSAGASRRSGSRSARHPRRSAARRRTSARRARSGSRSIASASRNAFIASKASTIGKVGGAAPAVVRRADGVGEGTDPVLGHLVRCRGWEGPADEGLVDGHAATLSPPRHWSPWPGAPATCPACPIRRPAPGRAPVHSRAAALLPRADRPPERQPGRSRGPRPRLGGRRVGHLPARRRPAGRRVGCSPTSTAGVPGCGSSARTAPAACWSTRADSVAGSSRAASRCPSTPGGRLWVASESGSRLYQRDGRPMTPGWRAST